MSADKQRWPAIEAMKVAEDLIASLLPTCERICFAGSLRRRKPTVGDVEILYIPRYEERADGFFDKASFNVADEHIDRLLLDGTLRKRPSVKGTFSWGEKNKLAVHRSGIPVDLFATTAESWYNYLVCRTGGAENNVAIASAAQRKGWQWNPYEPGFSRIGHVERMTSERDVFEFVGLPYLPPEMRT